MTSSFPKRLSEGYRSFRTDSFARERQRYDALASHGQKPTIMIIACCDSRAAPEIVFDASPGEVFVVRNVANLVPPYAPDGSHHSTSAALEYGVLQLRVEHIVIMGHGRCGGISAIVNDSDPLSSGDFIGQWLSQIRDVAQFVERDSGNSEHHHETRVERANVEHSLANLRTFPWIRQREQRGELSVHGAWFDIALGELHVLDDRSGDWSMLEGADPA
ncbi:carbonic anhydrase [Anderseniella sp. Alg231-50]|uniref:carbonic anhydrase n=1 Tax=Anderseniella sp. Alg231-50 TaxID=1922226 RepID=UPI000D55D9FF